MGYTTDFSGKFSITPKLNSDQVAYLQRFSETRRMKRDPEKAEKLPDPLRLAVGLPIGEDGGYFVGGEGYGTPWESQRNDKSVLNNNTPPNWQKSLWCKWTVSDDGKSLMWDGGEKFYDYTKWITYITENFLEPWGCKLNGAVKWRGEERDNRGVILLNNNQMAVIDGEEYKTWKSEQAIIKKAKAENKLLTGEVETVITTGGERPTVKTVKM